METVIEIFNWFWSVKTDDLIIPFAKANVIILSVISIIVRWWVKRTPSPDDDALIDNLLAVLPRMKKRP